MIEVTKKAVLFDKAIADFYIAETINSYRPDFALYHLLQCTEKVLKGALVCYSDNFEYDHDIRRAVEALNQKVQLTGQCLGNCSEMAQYSLSVRYKRRITDPTAETVNTLAKKVQAVMTEIAQLPEVERYYNEALEVNLKMLHHLEEKKPDIERKPLEELLQDIRQSNPKKKEENQRKDKNRKQEFIK